MVDKYMAQVLTKNGLFFDPLLTYLSVSVPPKIPQETRPEKGVINWFMILRNNPLRRPAI